MQARRRCQLAAKQGKPCREPRLLIRSCQTHLVPRGGGRSLICWESATGQERTGRCSARQLNRGLPIAEQVNWSLTCHHLLLTFRPAAGAALRHSLQNNSSLPLTQAPWVYARGGRKLSFPDIQAAGEAPEGRESLVQGHQASGAWPVYRPRVAGWAGAQESAQPLRTPVLGMTSGTRWKLQTIEQKPLSKPQAR